MAKKGFTLIELLVVVLIIGILSAIAVPQYQYAVYKARYVQLISVVENVVNAQERYRLAMGEYSVKFDTLDIDMPPDGRYAPSANSEAIVYPKFTVSIIGSPHNVAIARVKISNSSSSSDDLSYYHYYSSGSSSTNQRQCRCESDESCKICEKLGAVYSGIFSGSNTKNYLFNR